VLRASPTLLALALLLAGCGAVSRPPKSIISPPGAKTIHVGIEATMGNGPGFVAKEKGFFGDLEVDFAVFTDDAIRQNAFISGNTQMTATTIDLFSIAAAQNTKGSIFMVLDASNGADGIVAAPTIKTPQDFKGKRVAYARVTASHFLLVRYLQKNGVSMDDIERVEVDDSARAADALTNGSADVAVTCEPFISELVKDNKGHLVVTSATFPGQVVDVLAVNPDLLEHRKADLQKFVNGWLRAVEYINTHPEEARAILARNYKTDEKEVSNMANGVTLADLAINRDWLLPHETSKAVQLFDEASQVWLDEKLISSPHPGKTRIFTDFVENADPNKAGPLNPNTAAPNP